MEKIKKYTSKFYWSIQKKDKKIIFCICSVLIIPKIISCGWWNVLKAIPAFSAQKAIFLEIEKSNPNWLVAMQTQPLRSITTAMCVLGVLILAIKLWGRPVAYVLVQKSLSASALAPIDKSISDVYRLKTYEINLYPQIEKGQLEDALVEQNRKVKELTKKRKAHQPLYYYGIAHTPFVFHAGYSIGNETKNEKVLHMNRQDSCFRPLPEMGEECWGKRPDVSYHSYDVNLSTENLLAVIDTSFEIKESDIDQFQVVVDGVLWFKFDNRIKYSPDSLSAQVYQKTWKDAFWETVKEKCKELKTKTVHLVISSSTDFTFLLGQNLSQNHDVDFIVYHYKASETPCYPWGINIKKEPHEAIVLAKNV